MNKVLLLNVIENALIIEDKLSHILRTLLDIDNFDSKTLGHKTSSLSFIMKVNLLYDIEKINKETYNLLQMFGEIRNQFIHNIDADSFSIVLDRINKKNKLLKIQSDFSEYFNNAQDEVEKDKVYELAFSKLTIDVLKILDETYTGIIQDKIDKNQNEINSIQKENLEKVLNLLGESIDEFAVIFTDAVKESTGYEQDWGNSIKNRIIGLLKKKVDEIN